jgi:hypothetical protein
MWPGLPSPCYTGRGCGGYHRTSGGSALWPVLSAAFLGVDIARDERPLEELAEDPPLVAALVLAMLAYARRLLVANDRLAGLLDRQRQFVPRRLP